MDVLFGQSEVDHVHHVRMLPHSHQEVVWLNVPMQDVLLVNGFDSVDELLAHLQDSPQGELFAVLDK